jgi:cystathionine beta-lyase family protein involved in aluminum resistance
MVISEKVKTLINDLETNLAFDYKSIDEISFFNQNKVLQSFIKNKVALRHFSQTTGYGYDDIGRDTLNLLYADVFKAESAIVSPHLLSGTHAISTVLYGILRPSDCLLCVTGRPYDTLIDIIEGGEGSLKDFNVSYQEIDISRSLDENVLKNAVEKYRPKMVLIQRSRGYSLRNPLSCADIEKICGCIKKADSGCVIFVDNCYGEFTEKTEPLESGADIIAGSLIKNPGGGIAPNGGYIAGKKKLIDKVYSRLTTPSTKGEIGSNYGGYQYFYQGFFLAPHITAQSLKGACLMEAAMKAAGCKIIPEKKSDCYDIIRSVEFETEEQLIAFCRTIQRISPVDSFAVPYPWDMPGYDDKVIMAAGCFVQGSSIELSCDAPIRKPYIAYCQGGLTYEHVKLAAMYCMQSIFDLKK